MATAIKPEWLVVRAFPSCVVGHALTIPNVPGATILPGRYDATEGSGDLRQPCVHDSLQTARARLRKSTETNYRQPVTSSNTPFSRRRPQASTESIPLEMQASTISFTLGAQASTGPISFRVASSFSLLYHVASCYLH